MLRAARSLTGLTQQERPRGGGYRVSSETASICSSVLRQPGPSFTAREPWH